MTNVWLGVLIGLGVLAFNALLWSLLLLRFRRQSSRLREEIAASGETLLAEPSRGLYQGGGDYVSLRTQGVAALTDRRIIFRQPIGSDIEIPLSQIVGITQNRWFTRPTRRRVARFAQTRLRFYGTVFRISGRLYRNRDSSPALRMT